MSDDLLPPTVRHPPLIAAWRKGHMAYFAGKTIKDCPFAVASGPVGKSTISYAPNWKHWVWGWETARRDAAMNEHEIGQMVKELLNGNHWNEVGTAT